MKTQYKLIILILSIIPLFLNLVNANGLNVLNNNQTINITKIYDTNSTFIFTLRNEEPYDFFNISFENNNLFNMPTLNNLVSGAVINITVTVKTNSDFIGNIRVKGYYANNVGIQNKTYNVTVNFDDGISNCAFTIIKGDKVTWSNNVADEIRMRNENTQEYVSTLSIGQNYTTNFNVPETFTYSFYRRGYRFTDTCTITVLDDRGLVNDPNLDAFVNVSLKVSYEPTILNSSILENNYTLDFYKTDEGIITLKNIGDKIAHNITLTNSWFNFNRNNFDLNPGESKVIIYELSPIIINTAETNQSYVQNVSITGNFDTIIENFSIFINYAVIDNGNLNMSNESTIIDYICSLRPDLCNKDSKIIYRYIGNGTKDFNVTFDEEQVKQMYGYILEQGDAYSTGMNYIKEKAIEDSRNLNETAQKIQLMQSQLDLDKQSREQNNGMTFFATIIIFIIIIAILIAVIGVMIYRKNKAKEYERQ